MNYYEHDKPTEASEIKADEAGATPAGGLSSEHGAPEVIGSEFAVAEDGAPLEERLEAIEESKKGWFAYMKTRDFLIVLVLGQILSLCDTATNTFSTLLVNQGTSIPAFQNFFNYAVLGIIYTCYTLYKYGVKKWVRLIWKDGWKYIILSFLDVEGNYFTVLAYRYSTILSCQLIEFWAIVMVVIVSFLFLKVKYHPAQILGILICVAGEGILIASDHITGADGPGVSRGNQIKGDLFALVGATFYGLDNVAEEFLVSKRPVYEVVGQLGFWGSIINGVQAAIFDRGSFQAATWNGQVGGYLVGYTGFLTLFYSLAPLSFRMSSAAFFNISLLTGSFWGTIIGIRVFGYTIYYLYPIAFVLIIIGLILYFIGKKVLGEAIKPWLGKGQLKGISGLGTARRRAENPNAIV
ncbi:MAG: hypothetical protein MMC33_003759 [Icmadophila ericetorum]|nr:hypothetical protein [Icmadophila ericetorum]